MFENGEKALVATAHVRPAISDVICNLYYLGDIRLFRYSIDPIDTQQRFPRTKCDRAMLVI